MGSGEPREGHEIFLRISEQLRCFRVNTLQHVNDFRVLVVNLFGITLAENRADQGRDHFLSALGQGRQSIAQEIHPRPLAKFYPAGSN